MGKAQRLRAKAAREKAKGLREARRSEKIIGRDMGDVAIFTRKHLAKQAVRKDAVMKAMMSESCQQRARQFHKQVHEAAVEGLQRRCPFCEVEMWNRHQFFCDLVEMYKEENGSLPNKLSLSADLESTERVNERLPCAYLDELAEEMTLSETDPRRNPKAGTTEEIRCTPDPKMKNHDQLSPQDTQAACAAGPTTVGRRVLNMDTPQKQ
jgi:hypothetical protein